MHLPVLVCSILLAVAPLSAAPAPDNSVEDQKEIDRTYIRNQENSAENDVETARSYLTDLEDTVARNYVPGRNVTREFHQRCAAALTALSKATTGNEAFGIIADAFASLDPRIRFYPPARSSKVDYGWRWQLFGNNAYVTQVDQVGDAKKQGLMPGDKVLAIQDLPLNRETAQQAYYAFNTIAPSRMLRVRVQSFGGEPRSLTLAATLREPPKIRSHQINGIEHLEYVRTKRETQLDKEFRDLKNHVRHVGQTMVWHMDELDRRISDVSDGLKETAEAKALILDLRGRYVRRPETVLRLLDGVFAEQFVAGVIQGNGSNDRLHVSGGDGSFHGTVLVLIDAETGMYAEMLARIVQWKQRGVIIGDRTMGRIFKEEHYGRARGVSFNFTNAFVSVPAGEVVLAAEPQLDGRGVIPDLLLIPKPSDLAGRRDVVLAKALAMLKENVSPEEAYAFFHKDEADEDN
jgi:C-terminal processing protease CtpA/Prc